MRSNLRRRVALAAAAVSVVALGACAPAPTWRPAAGAQGPADPSPSSAAPPEITLAFGGDVHFTERTLGLLDDPATAFGPVSQIFTDADVAMINLESAVTTRGTAEPKTFHFRTPDTAYEAIKAAGIDVITLANNHALDYGRVGLEDTIVSAEKMQMPIVGVGRTVDEAYAAWTTEVKGVKIAFIGLSQIGELSSSWKASATRSGMAYAFDVARSVAAVRKARQAADVVVVFMHWGTEYAKCPNAQQKSIAKKLSDAGASIIVGSHVHVLQGDGWLGKSFVAYGMSNFLWWLNDAATNDTGVWRITLTGSTISRTEFLPAYIDRDTGQPVPSSGEEADRITKELGALRPCTGLASAPS